MASCVAVPGVLTIDLKALAENYRILRGRTGPDTRTAGVVKADAYGLGMLPVAGVLREQGCRDFFVATPEEALTLRAGLPGVMIAVFGGILPGIEGDFIARGIVPVLNCPEDIERWRKSAAKAGRKLGAILHFDTGMNRLGFGAQETHALLGDMSVLDGLDVKMIMSHFACADEKDHPLTGQQAEQFARISARFPGAEKSLANSSGVFRDRAFHYDVTRPGMALYGLNPTPETANPMKPVVRLEVQVLQVRTARRGETAGYGASYRFEKDTRLATVGLGYADGFLRSLSKGGTLYFNGVPCPIRGRVSMDLTIVETGDLCVRPGDMMEIIGPHQDADALAAAAGTIGYEILTGLGPRYRRVY